MEIEIGFSPCPNDTFIFDALVNAKIDTGIFTFKPVLADVQTLNNWAISSKLAVTKISYGVLPLVTKNYAVLNAGSALGNGVGPLLISKSLTQKDAQQFEQPVAIPGENTTANLLFSLAYPGQQRKSFMKYNEIEDYVLHGRGNGVIIHENRFTYAEKGLYKIIDLGDYWEQTTSNPIPLGGIVVSRSMEIAMQMEIDALIRKSIAYAFDAYPELAPYVAENSQEMSEEVMRKHIDLYVNNYSLHLGEVGRTAIAQLVQVYCNMHNLQEDEMDLHFVNFPSL